jgi:hypothetical protein
MLDLLGSMNEMTYGKLADPETRTRIAQYEMAFRMQSSVPELTNTTEEPPSTWKCMAKRRRPQGRSLRLV